MSSEIIKSTNFEHLLAKHQYYSERYKKIFQDLVNLDEEMRADGYSTALEIAGNELCHSPGYHRPDFTWTQQRIDANFWRKIMSHTGLYRLMSHKMREDWLKSISDQNISRHKSSGSGVPEFNQETVIATFQNLFEKKEDILADGLIAVYERMQWDKKTNDNRKSEKNIFRGDSYSLGYQDHLVDLLRICCILSGLPEPDGNNSLHQYSKNPDREFYWSHLLSFKIFKNRNIHARIHSQDLIDKMNLIVSRKYPNTLTVDKKSKN